MHFLVLGYDGTDDAAIERRLAVRDAHLAGAKNLKASGNLLFAAAMLNDSEEMCGSMLAMCFESRAVLDEWLGAEPYVLGKVWERMEIFPCAVPPMFLDS